MCGICCRLRRYQGGGDEISELKLNSLTRELLHNRGPNAHSDLIFQTETVKLLFSGFVLWQQGDELCRQPYTLKHHVLLINGDIFTKRGDNAKSDTEWLTERIDECNDSENDFFELFRNIEGPYSIVYFNKKTEDLFFVRDVLGRQSLLIAKTSDGDLMLGSVLGSAKQQFTECMELPPLGIYRLNISSQTIQLYPWQILDETNESQLHELEEFCENNIKLESPLNCPWLNKSPKFKSFNFQEILRNFVNKKPFEIFEELLLHDNVNLVCDELMKHLENSIIDRITATPSYCRICMTSKNGLCIHSKVGILFSGGIDCTILAVLTDKLLAQSQSIDLINVSFEKVRNHIDYNTPDRISAKDSLIELQHLCPNRTWNLIEVNIARSELNEALKHRIVHLVYPLNSILDESLGSVLWFGARGFGTVNGTDYSSNCRVLLIGSGADELFGGYTRHRNAFIRSNPPEHTPYERLENELEFDFNRLPSRNLARDDRIIGDFGVTARSPYVEEHFVCFVRSLKAHQKCYHALAHGVGDKLLLRLCGYRLGLRNVTVLKKRAMQFGSRVADSKQNANDVSKSLTQ